MDIEQIIRDYLPNIIHMSLSTSKDNKPWATEVHFAYDDDLNLYFRSLLSRRHSQEIASNPQVAGSIIVQHQLGEYPHGVYFEGVAQRLEAGDDQNKAFELLHTRVNASEDATEEATRPDGHQFYKISVEIYYVFGKCGNETGKKYALAWKDGVEP